MYNELVWDLVRPTYIIQTLLRTQAPLVDYLASTHYCRYNAPMSHTMVSNQQVTGMPNDSSKHSEVESGKVAGNQAPILSSQTNSEAGQISRSDYDMETLTQVIALYSGR